jgi:cytochrome c oxidase subunit 6a
MFPQRNMFRFAQRVGQQSRSSPVRGTVQRRFNSTENKPSWVVDNHFNREREAVKHHAAATSGMSFPFSLRIHRSNGSSLDREC